MTAFSDSHNHILLQMTWYLVVLLVPLLFSCLTCQPAGSGDEDLYTTAQVMIRSRGYNYEYYNVVTNDGYYIALYRIINPLRRVLRQPVLFITTLGNGVEYLRNSPGGSPDEPINPVGPNLGFECAKRGFDVWLMDYRGSISPPTTINHTYLNADTDLAYWDYSFDELAFFDIPTAIDFIRSQTNRDKIGLVAFEYGTTMYFFLASRVPRFNHIVQPFIAIAPSFGQYNSGNDKSEYPEKIIRYKERRGQRYQQKYAKPFVGMFCRVPLDRLICNPIIYSISVMQFPGYKIGSANYDRLSIYASTGQTSYSFWIVVQTYGFSLNQRTTMIDINPEVNVWRYGVPNAPEYFAEHITNPEMHFISAPSDLQFDEKDLEIFKRRLGVRVKSHFRIPVNFTAFSYLDGKADDVATYVNAPVIRALNEYS